MQLVIAKTIHALGPCEGDALVIDGTRLLAVGPRAELGQRYPEATRVDLGHRALVPGFIDAHHHLSMRSALQTGVDCRPDVAPSIDALLQRLAGAAERLEPGAWVVGHGYDELELAERRHPTRDELDSACPQNPVLLFHYSCHEIVASSRALELAGIRESTPEPHGGVHERDRRGRLTGRLIESALCPVERLGVPDRLARSADEVLERMDTAQDELFRVGITHVADPTVSSEMHALYLRALSEGRLRVGVTAMPVSELGYLRPGWDVVERGPRTGEGDERYRVGPLKLVFDGANRCALCASSADIVRLALAGVRGAARTRRWDVIRTMADTGPRREGGAWRTGFSFLEGKEARELVARATGAGFSLAMHAIGNAATDEVIAAVMAARTRHGDVPAPRIEHASFLKPDQPRRIADAGIAVVAQPAFLRLPAMDLVRMPGSFLTLPLRSLLDAGVCVAGSSDAPVIDFDPIAAMRTAVTRRTASGDVIAPGEAITPAEALALYTRDAARVCGELERRGTLEPGKRADFAVLSADPLASLDDARVEQTWVGGERVFER